MTRLAPLFRTLLLSGASLAALAGPWEDGIRRIQETGLKSGAPYRDLGLLCDQVGNRLSGSPQLDKAIAWAVELMKAKGFANVHTEPVMVPHWERRTERATLLLPRRQPLSMLGLGMSVPTRRGGITADVLAVTSFDELTALPDARVKGRIVLFDEPYRGYGGTVDYRWGGAIAAARKGAVGVLIRSVTPVSLDTPHTGTMGYEKGVPPIPAAALSVEDAAMLHRMGDRGERVRVCLEMNCRTLPDAPSANVVGEIPGSAVPEEIVLMGGHLDSWDVGQGALDDGAGAILTLEAASLVKEAGLHPRRTLRVVLFTNEENGSRGAKAYALAHKGELSRHVVAIESDEGNGRLQGFSLELDGHAPAHLEQARGFLARLKPYLDPLGAGTFVESWSGVDITPCIQAGVPGLSCSHEDAHYFDYHHSRADTFDKVDKDTLTRNVATLAAAVYLLADMPDRLAPAR
jgi:hypothetical protein